MTKTEELKKLKTDIEDLKSIVEILALSLPEVEQQTLYIMLNRGMYKEILAALLNAM